MGAATKLVGLDEAAKRWRKALSDGETGPLRIAAEVVEIAEHWDAYKDDAEGLSATAWCKKHLNETLAWFARRKLAVDRIGRESLNSFEHTAAVWLVGQIPDALTLERAKRAVLEAQVHHNHGNPMSLAQIKPVVLPMIGAQARSRATCPRCAALVARVAELEEMLRN